MTVTRALRGLIDFLAGEKLLDWLKLPNGGTMVFIRSLVVTGEVYFIALWLRSLFHAESPLKFEFGQLFHDLPETLPWIGAIFAFSYAAFYARFSSQWTYLAGFYNQLMATQAQIAGTAPTLEQRDPDANPKIQLWKAAFVEDAQDLHLATKKMFSLTVWFILEQPAIFDTFVTYTPGGANRLTELVNDLKHAIGEDKLRAMGASDELLRGDRPPDPVGG
jgi:hypothetical protein